MRRTAKTARPAVTAIFLLLFAANCAAWWHMRYMQSEWANVPPPPSVHSAAMGALGDRQFAYRTGALMLQNFGDTGGRSTRLDHYDFDKLGAWFRMEDGLDPTSSYIPYLASFYYGATQNGAQLRPVVDYLASVGRRAEDDHSGIPQWRWMGQAVYLARFRLNDLPLALTLANELAAMDRPGMPAWTKQMPAFVMNAQGDKAAAYALMMSILKDDSRKMQKAEVNFMIWYICKRLLDDKQAAADPVCTSNPEALK